MSPVRFKKNLIASSIAVVLGGSITLPVFAEEVSEEETAEQNNTMVVTGIRGSLKTNINRKRQANASKDVVTAEDIGLFPDKNVAESLARIPGVTIQRQFGEGNAVSIRGAGIALTKTTLNGQNVASTGWFVLEPARRSFNYELLPSEIVGDLEVYKSSQADLVEGGIGGTVVINTRKPTSLDANTIYGSLEFQKENDSGETNPQLSAMYSWKNEAENFGVLVAAVAQDRSLQRQGSEAFWEWGAGPVGFEQDRKRSAFTGTFEFSPSEDLSFTVNAMKMEMEADNTNYALWLTQADHSWNGDGLVPDEFLGDRPGFRGVAVRGALNTAFYQARPREATMNSDVLDFKMEYKGDNYELTAQIGDTSSTGGTDFEMVVDDGVNTPITGGTYDFTGNYLTWNLPNGIGASGVSMADYDPGSLVMGTGSAFNKTPKTDEEKYFETSISFDLTHDTIESVKAGFRMSDHNTTSRQFFFDQVAGFDNRISTAGLATGFYNVGAGNYQITRFDADAIKDWARASIIGQTEELGSYSEIQEDNAALYVMANFSTDKARGNFGVRYVTTDATSTYYLDDVKTETDASYSEFLPSFNLAYSLSNDLLLRANASKTMARPQYADMYVNPSVTGTNDDLDNNQFWIVGNVGLKPFLANQLDVGLEYYFDDSSILAATIFYKDAKNFIAINEYSAPDSDIPFGGTLRPSEVGQDWTVQEKNNAKKAKVQGLELQYQHTFDNDFGLIANYTYTDSSTANDTFSDGRTVLSDSSKNAYNISGFYEKDDYSVRLSYNWRSEYMLRETGAYGNRRMDDYGTLDLSSLYRLTDNIDISFDVINITEEDALQFGYNTEENTGAASGFATGFPLYQYETARRIAVGITARF